MTKIIILSAFIFIGCKPTKDMKIEIDNTIIIHDINSESEITGAWKESNLKLLRQYKDIYVDDSIELYAISGYEKRINFENNTLGTPTTRESFLTLWLKNTLKDKDSLDEVFILERFIEQSSIFLYQFYVERYHQGYCQYYLFTQNNTAPNGWDSITLGNSSERYLRSLFYLSKEILGNKVGEDYKHFPGDERFLIITMIKANAITSNILLLHDKEQYKKIRYLYSRVDSILWKERYPAEPNPF